MGNIRVQLGPPLLVLDGLMLLQTPPTLRAVRRPKMVLGAAIGAVSGQLATGHRHKGAAGAFDDFQVTHDEAIVERNRAERLQSLAGLFHELDANLGDFHGCSPCGPGVSTATFDCQGKAHSPGPQQSGHASRVPRVPTQPKVACPASTHPVPWTVQPGKLGSESLDPGRQILRGPLQTIEQQPPRGGQVSSNQGFQKGSHRPHRASRSTSRIDVRRGQPGRGANDDQMEPSHSRDRFHLLSPAATDRRTIGKKRRHVASQLTPQFGQPGRRPTQSPGLIGQGQGSRRVARAAAQPARAGNPLHQPQRPTGRNPGPPAQQLDCPDRQVLFAERHFTQRTASRTPNPGNLLTAKLDLPA